MTHPSSLEQRIRRCAGHVTGDIRVHLINDEVAYCTDTNSCNGTVPDIANRQ